TRPAGCARLPYRVPHPVPRDAGRQAREPMATPRRVARWLVLLAVAGLCGPAGAQERPPDGARPREQLPPPRPEGPEDQPPAAPATLLGGEARPIDLASALKLAGVQNPEILLARERVVEAAAQRQLAAAQILPTLNAGTNFDNHTGPLQRSTGQIL